MGEQTQERSYGKYALGAFLSMIIFVILYKCALNDLMSGGYADLLDHTRLAENISFSTLKDAWLQRPYLLWHLCVKAFISILAMPVNEAAAAVCGMFGVACYYVTFFLLDKFASKYTGKEAGILAACTSAMLAFVMPLYMSWFNESQFGGQFGINPIYNPTHMAVKSIGLLVFMAAIDLIRKYKEKDTIFFTGEKVEKQLYTWFGFFLLLSAFTKPTFMYMFVPAGVVYLLIDLVIALVKKDGSVKKVWSFMWRMACACIPALLYLLLEYASFYLWGGTNEDAHVAIYPFLYAWKMFTPSVPKSIVLAMCFPLWMLITNFRYFISSVEGRLGLIGYGVGVLEFAFFVETGEKLTHLNFCWPMMSGMLLFWVVAAARLVALTRQAEPKRWHIIMVSVGWFLLAVHVFCGTYYINPSAYLL